MGPPFLDTNILLRHLLQDHADHSPRATAYLARVARGELQVQTADTVIFETVFTLQRHYGHPKDRIRDALVQLLDLPGIALPTKDHCRRALDLYVNHNVDFADAYHAALMERRGIDEIVSFDRGFDRVPWIHRLEP